MISAGKDTLEKDPKAAVIAAVLFPKLQKRRYKDTSKDTYQNLDNFKRTSFVTSTSSRRGDV